MEITKPFLHIANRKLPFRLIQFILFFGKQFYIDDLRTWLFAQCANCGGLSVWHNNEMVYPERCPVAEPNPDMPEAVEDKYREAAKVVSLSPVSAAALLRLALQLLLMDVLGDESTRNIYKDIDALKNRQLDSSLITALDIIRITGNGSVHPGTIDLNESKDDVLYLFDLLNMICNQCYTQPRPCGKCTKSFQRAKGFSGMSDG